MNFFKYFPYFQFINWALATGVYIVVALSLERYVSVVFPLHFRVWNSPQRAMKAIMVAYILPALFYLPYGFARYSVSEKLVKGEIVYGAIDSDMSKSLQWQVKTFFKVFQKSLALDLQMDAGGVPPLSAYYHPLRTQLPNYDCLPSASTHV